MSEYNPIVSIHDLKLCDSQEMLDGYWSGFHGEPEPGSNRSKSFWHGWRNGRVDGNHSKIDYSQQILANVYVQHQKQH